MPALKTVRGVRWFLGAARFFRHHIPHFAAIASPLTCLTKKDAKFIWGKEQQDAFDRLEILTHDPILRKPDFSREFEIHTDTSKEALGACLMQRSVDGVPYAVSYSRRFKDVESQPLIRKP